MEWLNAILLGMGGLLVAVFGKLLSEEVSATLPLAIRWLLERAVLRVPPEARESYGLRVASKLKRWPGKVGKLLIALLMVWESRDAFSATIHADIRMRVWVQADLRRMRRHLIVLSGFFLFALAPLVLMNWDPVKHDWMAYFTRTVGNILALVLLALIGFVLLNAIVRYWLISDLAVDPPET
jgi:hypothetical protein